MDERTFVHAQGTSPNTQAAVFAASSTANNALDYYSSTAAAMSPPQPANPLSLASTHRPPNPFLAGASISMHNPHPPSSAAYTNQTQPIAENPRSETVSTANNPTAAATNESDIPTTEQASGPGGPTATAPFLRDFSLVAEAAKRAQMSVVMRDLESVTL